MKPFLRTIVAAGAVALTYSGQLTMYAQSAPMIPLRPGLTVVTAIASPQGDGESIKRIEGHRHSPVCSSTTSG